MHPIENMMKATMEEIREMIDVNTIVGDPVHTQEGAVIIPISKVSFGFLAGGGEYGEGGSSRQENNDMTDNPFAGGGSAGISLNPMAFLVVQDENVRLLPVNFNSTVDRIVDLIPQAVGMMRKKDKQSAEAENADIKLTGDLHATQSSPAETMPIQNATVDGHNYDKDGNLLKN